MHWLKSAVFDARNPLFLLVLMLAIDMFASFGVIWGSNEIFVKISQFIGSVHPAWIAALSVVEHTVGINVYFPAAVVILVAMGNTYGSPDLAFMVFIYILVGQYVGYSMSFLIGRLSSTKAEVRLSKSSMVGFFLTFIHPHSGALTSFVVGSAGTPTKQFLLFLTTSLCFWSPVWAMVSYFGLVKVVSDVGWDTIFYTYMVIWICIILLRSWRARIQ